MKPLRTLLTSDSGELLGENMVSLMIITGVALAAAGIYMPTSAAVSNAAQATSRSIMLKTILSDSVPRLDTIGPAPVTVTGEIRGREVPVVLWRENAAGTTVLAGTVAKRFDDGTDLCTGPATVDDTNCISARIPVPASGPDVTELDLIPGPGAGVFTAAVPAGVQEVRYVFKAAAAGADGKAVFTAGAGEVTVDIPAGAPGYYFGRLLVDPGSTVTLTLSGATVDLDTVMIYEAPRA